MGELLSGFDSETADALSEVFKDKTGKSTSIKNINTLSKILGVDARAL
jgi:hypothetical protein